MDNIILKIDNVSKSFPRVKANKNVTFNIKRNTVHALLGENGAGKSTFVKILYGLLKPDDGKLYFNDNPIVLSGDPISPITISSPDGPSVKRGLGEKVVYPKAYKNSNSL